VLLYIIAKEEKGQSIIKPMTVHHRTKPADRNVSVGALRRLLEAEQTCPNQPAAKKEGMRSLRIYLNQARAADFTRSARKARQGA
jgi:hypothetical protein